MLPTDPEMVLLQGEGVVPEPLCANKVRNGPASTEQGFSTASQGSYHVYGTLLKPTHLPYPTFLIPQNLSSKWIAPTDNIRPKSDDTIWRHWWLTG